MLTFGTISRRTWISVSVFLGVCALGAWLLTIQLMSAMSMASMPDMPVSATAQAGLDIAMWAAMMVAMMLPSAVPVLATVSNIARSRKESRLRYVAPWVFGVGYLIVWLIVAVVSAGVDLGMKSLLMLNADLAPAVAIGSGVILIIAGVYQLSPLKERCLVHCRTPMGFLLSHWKEGDAAAVGLGIRHGFYCLGCCWALMATLLVTGTLGLVWPLTITFVVFGEKVLPFGRMLAKVTAVLLVVIGIVQITGLVHLERAMGM